MNRKMKTFGLALVAVLAMTAVMASAAQAQFTSDAESTTLEGVQKESHKFTAGTGIGGVTCTTATFSGSQAGKSASEITISPAYANCKDSLGRTVHIEENTLVYHFLSGEDKGKVTLTGHIKLTVTGSPHCTITISGDQTINGVTYTSLSAFAVLVTTHSNNITSSISGGFFACGTSATHSSTGTYTGTTEVKGNGGSAKISVD